MMRIQYLKRFIAMERLSHLSLEFDSIWEYSTDSLCALFVPPKFVPNLTQGDVFAVRIIFMPTFDSEFVITLQGDAKRIAYSIRSARVSMWHLRESGSCPRLDEVPKFKSMLPLGLWETKGECDAGLLPSCLQSRDSFNEKWKPGGYQIADGMRVEACRVDAVGQDEYRNESCRVWDSSNNRLCTDILTALKTDCSDLDAAALIDGALSYY